MTVFQRAAAAVLSLCAIGAAGFATPGLAEELGRDVIAMPVSLPGSFKLPELDPAPLRTAPTVAALATTPVVADDATATDLDAIDPDAYASLADAVASQSAPDTLSSELRCLAGAVYFEAKGEPLAGQLAVAKVIINRAKSGRFPASLCSVVTQPGQFSFIRGGQIPAVSPALTGWRTALAVAQVALGDAWDSPASQAMFFHARYVSPRWGKTRLASIGNHVFYR